MDNRPKFDIVEVLNNPKNGKFCCVVARKSLTLITRFLLIKKHLQQWYGILDSNSGH